MHRPIIGSARGSSKAWQEIWNGLSCLGESRQAFKSGLNKDAHEEEKERKRLRDRKTPKNRRGGPKERPAPHPAGCGRPAGGTQRFQADHPAPKERACPGAGADRGIEGIRRYRFPARHPESAWFPARTT